MTANNSHVGVKLAAEMERLGLKPAQIATLFEVKVPSVYDWLKHGRIHKKHYPALVAMSGRSLEWWLGMPEVAPMPQQPAAAHVAREKHADYKITLGKHAELIELFDALPHTEQTKLIASLREKNSSTPRCWLNCYTAPTLNGSAASLPVCRYGILLCPFVRHATTPP